MLNYICFTNQLIADLSDVLLPLIGVLALLVIALAGLTLRYRQLLLRERTSNLDLIRAANAQKAAIYHKAEKEQQRLARTSISDLGSLLASIRMEVLRKSASNQKPDEPRWLKPLSEGIATIRKLSQQLMPLSLHRSGIVSAINEWVEPLDGVEVRVFNRGDEVWLEERTALILFRVVQELIANGLKHSGSNLIECRFQWEDKHLLIAYRDWGYGFNPKVESAGIADVRLRVSALDGQIRVDSSAGRGTSIEIQVPLKS